MRILLLILVTVASCFCQTLTSTTQSSVGSAPSGSVSVTPTAASVFVDSIGTNVHLDFGSNAQQHFPILLTRLSTLGIRRVRTSGSSADYITKTQQLYSIAGIHTLLVVQPQLGLQATPAYWAAGTPVLVSDLVAAVGPGPIDSTEMPNEVDVFYFNLKWHPGDTSTLVNSATAAGGWGLYGVAITQDSYAAFKADPVLSGLTFLGPALGFHINGFPNNSLYGSVNYGAFHPYPYAGNTFSTPLSYGGAYQYFWGTTQPDGNLDEWPAAFNGYQPAFNPSSGPVTPMAATETGYYNGAVDYALSDADYAAYVPRLFGEYFRHGVVKTYQYDFGDDGTSAGNREDNFGMIRFDFTPKPAYNALKALITLLNDQGSVTPSPITLGVAVSPNGIFTRTQYYHDLLLRKANGDYYLMFWHEAANVATTNAGGILNPAVNLNPLPLPVALTLPAGIVSAQLYTYDANWNLAPQVLTITANQVALQATDKISVLRLSMQAPPTRSSFNGSLSGNFSLN